MVSQSTENVLEPHESVPTVAAAAPRDDSRSNEKEEHEKKMLELQLKIKNMLQGVGVSIV